MPVKKITKGKGANSGFFLIFSINMWERRKEKRNQEIQQVTTSA